MLATSSPDVAIEFRDVTKTYPLAEGGSREVLSAMNLQVPKGYIYGLLGPNGAGKSTMIKMMSGLAKLGTGDVRVLGIDVRTDPIGVKSSLGVMEQEINFDPFFTPYEVMELQGGLHGLRKHERRTKEILSDVHLWSERGYYSRQLSGGMKRRLMLAKAVVTDPEVLVLDEPTAGVDVELRGMMWDWVLGMKKRGKTILLTTHYLEEAEVLCDKVAIINEGKKIADDDKQHLMSTLGSGFLDLVLRDSKGSLDAILARDFEGAVRLEDNRNGDGSGSVKIRVPRREKGGQEIMAILNSLDGVNIDDVSFYDAGLEEIFLYYLQEDRKSATKAVYTKG